MGFRCFVASNLEGITIIEERMLEEFEGRKDIF